MQNVWATTVFSLTNKKFYVHNCTLQIIPFRMKKSQELEKYSYPSKFKGFFINTIFKYID